MKIGKSLAAASAVLLAVAAIAATKATKANTVYYYQTTGLSCFTAPAAPSCSGGTAQCTENVVGVGVVPIFTDDQCQTPLDLKKID